MIDVCFIQSGGAAERERRSSGGPAAAGGGATGSASQSQVRLLKCWSDETKIIISLLPGICEVTRYYKVLSITVLVSGF